MLQPKVPKQFEKDKIVWKWDHNGGFSVKSFTTQASLSLYKRTLNSKAIDFI